MKPSAVSWRGGVGVLGFGGGLRGFLFSEKETQWNRPKCPSIRVQGEEDLPWVRKFTATPNSPILPLEPIDFLQEGWR
jgi:hypothetical protein